MPASSATAVATPEARGLSEVLVARQPIFDPDLKVYGYELLYRSMRREDANVQDHDAATQHVITTAFVDIGLERLVENTPAFVNVSRDLLLSGDLEVLPPERVVLEILEDQVVDDLLLEAVSDLKTKGYRIALDDYAHSPEWAPMLELADMVKVDFHSLDEGALRKLTTLLGDHDVVLVAEKLEEEAHYNLAVELGYDFFQGFFFAKPRIVAGHRLQGNKLAILKLLASLHDPEVQVETVADLVGQDATLSYKLIRFINSAAISVPQKVESIQRAVVLLGLSAVKRMVSLTLIASVDDKPGELLRTALVRARMCELLCTRSGTAEPGSAFTVGLFSALDAMMDRPLPELLQDLPLAPEVSDALLDGGGVLGEALGSALSYEQGDWLGVSFGQIGSAEVGEFYAEAVEWAATVASEL